MTGNPVPPSDDTLSHARTLHESGHHGNAEVVLLDTMAAGVWSMAAYTLLASIERALNQPTREARALEQALAAACAGSESDDTVHLWTRLGAVRAWLGDVDASAAAYERAVRVEPENFWAQQGLARARLALQDLEGAGRSAKELERRFPEAAFAHLFAGHLHKALGDTPAACESYRRALERDGTLGEALYNLVDLAPPEPDDAIAARAAELTSRDDLAVADRVNAGFANARILDRAGRYAEAFDYVRRANDLAREDLAHRGIEYLPSSVEARITRTIAEYPPQSFCSTLDPLSTDLALVFVIGLPRSGTTLIEQILASHSDVQAGGELVFARECEHHFRERRTAAGRTGPVDPANPEDAELLEAARERYIDSLFERDFDGPWIVDKLPANFEIAGFLRLMFPDARLIHSRRDPRATCFSLYWANFGAHEPWYHDRGHLAHYYGQYRRLMAYWHRVIPAPFIEVVYEDLVRDPKAQIPALLEAIGLPFDSACLKYYNHERPILTASHAQVRQPMYTGAIDQWRRYSELLGPLRDLPLD